MAKGEPEASRKEFISKVNLSDSSFSILVKKKSCSMVLFHRICGIRWHEIKFASSTGATELRTTIYNVEIHNIT